VPILIPEINYEHCDIIPAQQKHYGWSNGLIVVKPNCSIQSYMIPIHALLQKGFRVGRMIVTTLQGLSGAGYPGPSSLDMVDNIIPYIGGEEEKSENEPRKVLGKVRGDRMYPADESISISAHCTRVPVIDGHSACISIEFAGASFCRRDQRGVAILPVCSTETWPSFSSATADHCSRGNRQASTKERPGCRERYGGCRGQAAAVQGV
jgi:aspartate-semialdehyde dehydrogenase